MIVKFDGFQTALSLERKARTARICLYTREINDPRPVLTGVRLVAEDWSVAIFSLYHKREALHQLHVNTVSLKLLC
jgi:hypothetical protein